MGNCKPCFSISQQSAADVEGSVAHDVSCANSKPPSGLVGNPNPVGTREGASEEPLLEPLSPGFVRQFTPPWSQSKGNQLQESVDRIFGTAGKSLLGLTFSFTIADPFLDGCPLVGCSTGFTELCGYGMEEIVGRNCRFLVDPVPSEKIDQNIRRHAKQFCEAVRTGKEYRIPIAELEPWMPEDRPADELLCMQTNARKDGSLFYNLFYMKIFQIGVDLGEEKPYIVGLQSELQDGKETLAKLGQNLQNLDENMDKVKGELASYFFVQCSMQRDR